MPVGTRTTPKPAITNIAMVIFCRPPRIALSFKKWFMSGDGEQCSPGYNGDKWLENFYAPYGQQDEQSEANRNFNGLCHRVRVSVSFITHGDSSAAMDWNDTLLQIIMWVEPPRL